MLKSIKKDLLLGCEAAGEWLYLFLIKWAQKVKCLVQDHTIN